MGNMEGSGNRGGRGNREDMRKKGM